MVQDLHGKIVVVTGAAEGIGFQIADKFLQNGAKSIILLDIHEVKGKEAEKILTTKYGQGKVEFYKCDVTKDLDEVSNMIFSKYKTVDVLINNAGVVDESSIKRCVNINTIAVLEWTTKFWEHMRTDNCGRGGTIINVASIFGFIINEFLPVYKATKFAVVGFTKSFGHKNMFLKYGVRILVLCPGFTKTALTEKFDPELLNSEYEEYMSKMQWQNPDAVGVAAVDVFLNAESGTAWKVIGGTPAEQVQ